MRAGPIAIIGASGQLARALVRIAGTRGVTAVAAGRPVADIGSADSMSAYMSAHQPGLVINAAAYTAVDKAESEPGAAWRVNRDGPTHLARLCAGAGVPLIHISTDYVFDGRKRSPYVEDDATAPLGVYGQSKAAGEDAVRAALARHIILRTAWVYGREGQNFLRTMLRLGAEREVVRVVADQHGTPTYADHLAGAVLDIAAAVRDRDDRGPWGTYHLTAKGATTWHGFSAEIFRQAHQAGRKTPRLEAITTAEYPAPAPRPQYSVLDTAKVYDTFAVALPDWQHGVAECMTRLIQ